MQTNTPATKLPKGISDFHKIRTEGYYYVDKSKFVVDLAACSSETLLFSRPRRFGKTLNMSMLKAWFEGIPTSSTESEKMHHAHRSKALFAGLVADALPGDHHKLRAQIPVIFLTFKDVKETNWSGALLKISQLVSSEILRLRGWWAAAPINSYLVSQLNSLATESLTGEARVALLTNVLLLASQALHQSTGNKVLILIDAYDTPIQQAFVKGHLTETVHFFRNFLSAGLKDNPHLYKGVLTGILRVSKESLFSGLNNLDVYSILRHRFSEHFGLLENEVCQLMSAAGADNKMSDVRSWYNGYVFGNTTVYNPWSVVSYADDTDAGLQPHWVNTADSSLVGLVISQGGSALRDELFTLLNGGSVEKAIDENVTLSEHGVPEDKAWSFLLFTGYLKAVTVRLERGVQFAKLAVPNLEVQIAYEILVNSWLAQHVRSDAPGEKQPGIRLG